MLNLNSGVEETPQNPNPTAQTKIRKKIGTVPKIVFGAALLLVIPMLGNTLAGTITINNVGGKVEFGQGVAQTVACDGTGVTISPAASYASGTQRFNISSIAITGIHVADSATACAGKTLKLYVVDTATALADYVDGTSIDNISIAVGNTGGFTTSTSGVTISGSSGTGTGETVTVTITSPVYSASDVNKIIIQTS
jgi:hypothetical protein